MPWLHVCSDCRELAVAGGCGKGMHGIDRFLVQQKAATLWCAMHTVTCALRFQ
jgi:hypothetical protein